MLAGQLEADQLDAVARAGPGSGSGSSRPPAGRSRAAAGSRGHRLALLPVDQGGPLLGAEPADPARRRRRHVTASISAIRELTRSGSPCRVAYSPSASARESTRASSCSQCRSYWAFARRSSCSVGPSSTQPLDLGAPGRPPAARRDPVAGPGVREAEGVAADQPHGAGRARLGVLGAADQRPVQPRRLAVAEHAEGQVEGVERRGAARPAVARTGRPRRPARRPRSRRRSVPVSGGSGSADPLGRLAPRRRGGRSRLGRAGEGVLRVDVADDRQHRVVRHVVGAGRRPATSARVAAFRSSIEPIVVCPYGWSAGKVSAFSSSIASPYGTLS